MRSSISNATKLTGIPDSTIRDWMENPNIKLNKYTNDEGKIELDLVELKRLLPTIVVFYNRKGGAGKTPESIMTAMYYHFLKQKVLICDFDPQENSSQKFLGFNHVFNLSEFIQKDFDKLLDKLDDEDKELMLSYYSLKHGFYTMNDGIGDDEKEEIIAILEENDVYIPYNETLYDFFANPRKPLSKVVKTYNEYIDVLPSRDRLDEFQNLQVENFAEYQTPLLKFFQKYSVIVIDCPPAMNGLSRLALTLADHIVVPFMPFGATYNSTISMLDKMINFLPYCKNLKNWTIFCTNVSERKLKTQGRYLRKIKEEAQGNVIEDYIPKWIKIEELYETDENLFDMKSNQQDVKNKLDMMHKAFESLDSFIYVTDEEEGVE